MENFMLNIVVTLLSITVLIGGLLYLFHSMEKKSKEKQEKKAKFEVR